MSVSFPISFLESKVLQPFARRREANKNLLGKTIFVTGATGGLGKAISKTFAARGANVTIFGRRKTALDAARLEIENYRLSENQTIIAVAIDLADAEKVDAAFKAQPIPDALYCVAGGNHAENGFLVDIKATDLENCMRNNYFSSAFPAKSMMGIWTEDDRMYSKPFFAQPKRRQIIFISSAAAFLGLPGSIAYTPAKCAQRALADTLRMEVMRYNCSESIYSIHCAFPGDFVSPGFYLEQDTKTSLTKIMQGTDVSLSELESRFPSSDKIAALIIAAVEKGDFIIYDSIVGSILFSNMIGPSPRRGLGVLDSLLTLLGWFVWPIMRRKWEVMCRKDGQEMRSRQQATQAARDSADLGLYSSL